MKKDLLSQTEELRQEVDLYGKEKRKNRTGSICEERTRGTNREMTRSYGLTMKEIKGPVNRQH